MGSPMEFVGLLDSQLVMWISHMSLIVNVFMSADKMCEQNNFYFFQGCGSREQYYSNMMSFSDFCSAMLAYSDNSCFQVVPIQKSYTEVRHICDLVYRLL